MTTQYAVSLASEILHFTSMDKKNVACHFSKQRMLPVTKSSAPAAAPSGVP